MTQRNRLIYLGARYNDEGGEGEGQAKTIDVNDILRDPDVVSKIRETDPAYRQLQSKASEFERQMAELKQQKEELEQQRKDSRFQGETLKKILGEDVTDEAEAFTRIQSWAEERYNPVVEKERKRTKELEKELENYQERERTYTKKEAFMKHAKSHKGIERGGEDLLFKQAQQFITLDEAGEVVYSLPDGRRANDAEEFLDEIIQAPDFRFFAARSSSTGGLNSGQPGGVRRMTKTEYRTRIATGTEQEQNDLIRAAQRGEIKLMDG